MGGKHPWLRQYPPHLRAEITAEHADALAMFRAAAERAPDAPLVHYFDRSLTVSEVDTMSDALACALGEELGVRRGDRIALFLQNVPQLAVAVLASWKAGAIVVPVNPMNKARELDLLLRDSSSTVLVCLESLYHETAAAVWRQAGARSVVTTSELDLMTDPGPWNILRRSRRQPSAGTWSMSDLVRRYRGRRPKAVELGPDAVAFLSYTSGTTGPPKGAMNTHGNVVFTAQVYRDWVRLTTADVVFGIAPLFHITGLIGHLAVSLLVPCPLVLGYRFDAPTYLDLMERYRPTFTIGAITAFAALMGDASFSRRDLSSLRAVYSGGQPIPSATADRFEQAVGLYVHSAYGLTETTSPTHLVPLGERAPISPPTGTLAAGVPVFNTVSTVVDDEGRELAPGEVGEIVVAGPQVVPGYWEKPEDTARTIRDGWLRTGDVGSMDENGWFYVVDRKKDLINASGYKVWPREVEEVLNDHPAVREAAVVGVPDEYRGETVRAFVSLQTGAQASGDELVAFCRARMAAYKYPRSVVILDDLPKTASGKILRRSLRAVPAGGTTGGTAVDADGDGTAADADRGRA